MINAALLASLVAEVPDKEAVYAADLEVASATGKEPAPIVVEREKTPRDLAIDGVAWHVFNSLRGANDDINGATFDDVRALVAEQF